MYLRLVSFQRAAKRRAIPSATSASPLRRLVSARLFRDMASQQKTSDVANGFASTSKVLRMVLQSGVLAVGAYLVINQEATAGIIIAGSILSARALAPVDLAIAHWKGFVAARQSWHRLNRLLETVPAPTAQTLLQNPSSRLSVEGVAIVPPGDQKIIVH